MGNVTVRLRWTMKAGAVNTDALRNAAQHPVAGLISETEIKGGRSL
jgi:hypothetical protein